MADAVAIPPAPNPFILCESGRLHAALSALVGRNRGRLLLVGFGFVIGWLPVVILAATAGTATGVVAYPFLADVDPWVRFFVVVPMAVYAAPFADRVLGLVVEHFRSSGMVPEACRAAFEADVARAQRLAASTTAEVALAVIVLVLPHVVIPELSGVLSSVATWATRPGDDTHVLTAAGQWYAWVSMPFVRFLLLRWVWRILVWCRLLWRTSRLPLAIAPGHPDRIGGLEFVTWAPMAFVPVLMAMSSLASAGSAWAISLGRLQLPDLRLPVVAFVAFELLLLLMPQLFFNTALARERRRALLRFGVAGAAAARAFDRQWTGSTAGRAEDLLESNQPGAMADYSSTYAILKEMQPSGLSIRRLARFALPLVAPFAPLLLFQYSAKEILQQVLQMFR